MKTLNEQVQRIKEVMGLINELGIGAALSQQPTTQGNPKLTCITFPAGADHVDVKTKSGYSLKLFTNNRVMNNQGADMGDWSCSQQNKCDITFVWDKDKDPTGKVSITYTETMLNCGGTTSKVQWVKETGKFPLLYAQYGPTIQTLQKALGVKPDTYLGIRTEKAILAKAPEYKRQTGVTQDIYNKIVSSPQPKVNSTVTNQPITPNIAPLD